MKFVLTFALLLSSMVYAHALVINEVMSNPTGDDGGREWIEIYNNSETDVDLSALTISIKGGTFVSVTPISGGIFLGSHGYAVISSTVSGVAKFIQDYPLFSKPLFKSSISLVNTGVTSIELKLGGVTADTLASYTAAKEGSTYSLLDGSFIVTEPSPGEENKTVSNGDDATTSPAGTQTTIPQMASPSSDIVLYLPLEKTVVAGAPSVFTVSGMTHAGKSIDNLRYQWSFGDGGTRVGSSTLYRYFYPGRYIAQVEATNGWIQGMGRMIVRVVSPELIMSTIGFGKYGSYIDITNPNKYDIDISDWKLSIDGALFSFPKNTLLPVGETRFSGISMGFASTTVSSSTLLKLLFPSMDEVLRISQSKLVQDEEKSVTSNSGQAVPSKQTATPLKPAGLIQSQNKKVIQGKKIAPQQLSSLSSNVQSGMQRATTTKIATTVHKKDTRVASFIRSVFGY